VHVRGRAKPRVSVRHKFKGIKLNSARFNASAAVRMIAIVFRQTAEASGR
jgi:hypothetical protein